MNNPLPFDDALRSIESIAFARVAGRLVRIFEELAEARAGKARQG